MKHYYFFCTHCVLCDCSPPAWRRGLASSQRPSHGANQRSEWGAAEEQPRLPAVLQWLQYRDNNPILLRGHDSFTRSVFSLLLSPTLGVLVHHQQSNVPWVYSYIMLNLSKAQLPKNGRAFFFCTCSAGLHFTTIELEISIQFNMQS